MIDNGPRSTGINLLTSPYALRRTSIFRGGVFVSTSLLGMKEQKPRGHVRILRCRTWSIIDESRLHLAFPLEKYRNQRFRHFGGNCRIFRKANHWTENIEKSRLKIKWNENFQENVSKIWVYLRRLSYFPEIMQNHSFLFSVTSFSRDHSALVIPGKHDGRTYSKMD